MLKEKGENFTSLSELGEFGLIERLTSGRKNHNEETYLSVGDDAAAIESKEGKISLLSTDMLVEGVHFDLAYTPFKHLGYKAVVTNISDIAAMNGKALGINISLGLSSKFSVEAIEELYEGIYAACDAYKVDLLGGDTTSSHTGLIISVAVVGEVKKEELLKRSGAKENELICVSGDLGAAFIGLNILEREKRIFLENPEIQPDLGTNHYALQRQLRPEARTDVKKILQELEIVPSAMIDVSDGIASDLRHICQASKLGCKVYEEKIPIDPEVIATAREFNLDPTVCALNGGEDYELLFTIRQEDFEKIKHHPDFSIIGHMCEASEGTSLISRNNSQHELMAQGWDGLKHENEDS